MNPDRHIPIGMKLLKGWILFVQLWSIVAVAQLILQLLNPHSLWNTDIPFAFKLRFLSTEALYSSAFAFASAFPIGLIPEKAVRIKWGMSAILSLLYACFLVISWGQSMLTTQFLTIDSLKMLVDDPVGMYLHSVHFHPLPTRIAPLAIAIGTLCLFCTLTILSIKNRKVSVIASSCVIMLIGTCYWYSVPVGQLPFVNTTPYDDPQAGKISSIGDHFTQLYLKKTGPHLAITGSFLLRNIDQMDHPSDYPILWKPQITLDSYFSETDSRELRRFSVMLILIESLREGIVQPIEDPSAAMPNLNALAAESLVFSRHYTTASHSNYSDLSPLSSHFPLRGKDTHVYPAHPTYPRVLIYDILKHLGYRTSIVSSQNENWGKMINYLKTDGLDELLHSENFEGNVREDIDAQARFWKNQRSGKVDDYHTINRAIDWIKKDSNQPFFMYMNLQNSHFPFDIGPGFERRFGRETLSFQPSFVFGRPEQAPEMFGRYLDSLAYIDAQLGRLFQWMKDSGLMDRTIIVITGDTGQAFMEHGVFGHANKLFDEVLRTPLLMRIPDMPHRIFPRLAQNVDIPPTVLGVLGLPTHPSFQGIDLIQTADDPERSVFLVTQSPFAKEYAIVKGEWKLVIQPYPREYRLYNMEQDPGETQNLIHEANNSLARLKSELHAWYNCQIQYYHDPRLHKTYYPPVLLNPE